MMNKALNTYNFSKEPYKRFFAAVCIVFKNSKVLLGVSTIRDFRLNKWVFPGGGREKGETIYQTAIRELKEEMGVTATPVNMSPIIDTDISGIAFIPMIYKSGSIKMNKEFSDADWFSLNELPKDIDQQNKSILKKFNDQLISNIKIEKSIERVKENTILRAFSIDLVKGRNANGFYSDNRQNRLKGVANTPYGYRVQIEYDKNKRNHVAKKVHPKDFKGHKVVLTKDELKTYNDFFKVIQNIKPQKEELFKGTREGTKDLKISLDIYWKKFLPRKENSRVENLKKFLEARQQIKNIQADYWLMENFMNTKPAARYVYDKYTSMAANALDRTEDLAKKAQIIVDFANKYDNKWKRAKEKFINKEKRDAKADKLLSLRSKRSELLSQYKNLESGSYEKWEKFNEFSEFLHNKNSIFGRDRNKKDLYNHWTEKDEDANEANVAKWRFDNPTQKDLKKREEQKEYRRLLNKRLEGVTDLKEREKIEYDFGMSWDYNKRKGYKGD